MVGEARAPLSLHKARVVTGLPLNATDELGAT